MSPKPLRGVGSGRKNRPENQAGSPPQNCPAFPPGLAGGSTTYLGTFRPTALVRPAGRCDGFTRRAVCPSKPLKTRRRYPWRAGGFCAIKYARTAPGQPSRTARAAAQAEHLEPDNAPVWIFLFARPKYGHAKKVPYAKPLAPPHQSWAIL